MHSCFKCIKNSSSKRMSVFVLLLLIQLCEVALRHLRYSGGF